MEIAPYQPVMSTPDQTPILTYEPLGGAGRAWPNDAEVSKAMRVLWLHQAQRERSAWPSTQLTLPIGGVSQEHYVPWLHLDPERLRTFWHGSNEPDPEYGNRHFVYFDYSAMAEQRSDLVALSRFCQHVEYADMHLSVAMDRSRVRLKTATKLLKIMAATTFTGRCMNSTLNRYDHLRSLLVHHWTPVQEVEPLVHIAFLSLSNLTPARSQLAELLKHDWHEAAGALARQLDGYVDQLKQAAELADAIERKTEINETAQEEARRDALIDELSVRAGGLLPLTTAAKILDVTRQALHKRVKSGSVLGLRKTPGGAILIPRIQIVEDKEGAYVVDGLAEILRPFHEAGAGTWSALQYLLDIDPLLGAAPIAQLIEKNREGVGRAARAFLGLGHG